MQAAAHPSAAAAVDSDDLARAAESAVRGPRLDAAGVV